MLAFEPLALGKIQKMSDIGVAVKDERVTLPKYFSESVTRWIGFLIYGY